MYNTYCHELKVTACRCTCNLVINEYIQTLLCTYILPFDYVLCMINAKHLNLGHVHMLVGMKTINRAPLPFTNREAPLKAFEAIDILKKVTIRHRAETGEGAVRSTFSNHTGLKRMRMYHYNALFHCLQSCTKFHRTLFMYPFS